MPMPDLSACEVPSGTSSEIRITLLRRGALPAAVDWMSGEAGPENPLRLGRVDEGYVVAYPEDSVFLVSADGSEIRWVGGDADALERTHHVLDRVLPLALNLRGAVVLHASAIAHNGVAIAFVGESGSGKSTMAAHLARRGAQFLTDDCLALRHVAGEWRVAPYYAGLRLWPESAAFFPGLGDGATQGASGKLRVDGAGLDFRATEALLGLLCFLGPESSAIEWTACGGRKAYFRALAESFSLDIQSRRALKGQMDAIATLVDSVPVMELRYPRRPEALDDVREQVLGASGALAVRA